MKKFILGITAGIVSCGIHAQVESRPVLIGRVALPAGKPVKATAVLCYWHIKTNNHSLDFRELPRHTRDLPRHVQADEQGNFKFESLDPALLYQVLVFAPGCQQQTFKSVDPAAGPLRVRLAPAIPTNAPPGTVVRGRLRDASGNPVAGALIRILGVTRNGSMHWPAFEIDFYAVSDDAGLFTVRGATPFTSTEGVVEAAGFSKALFEHWEPGDTIHELTLLEGRPSKAGCCRPASRWRTGKSSFKTLAVNPAPPSGTTPPAPIARAVSPSRTCRPTAVSICMPPWNLCQVGDRFPDTRGRSAKMVLRATLAT